VLGSESGADEERRGAAAYAAARRAALASASGRFLDADFAPGARALGRGAELEINFGGKHGLVSVPVVWRRPEELVDEGGLAAAGASLDVARDLERLAQRRGADTAAAAADARDARAPPASHLAFLLDQARIRRDNGGGVYPPRGGAAAWCFKREAEFRAEDVRQGGLGTCWMDAVVSLLATRDALLQRLFREEPFADARALLDAGGGAVAGAGAVARGGAAAMPLHPLGIYQCRLFLDGRWRVVTVDDLVPTNGFTGEPAFSASLRRQLWVQILEKAAAKAAGSYARLVGGQAGEALRLLTGAPCLGLQLRTNETQAAVEARHNSPGGEARCPWEARPLQLPPAATLDALWARLSAYYAAGFLLGASATDNAPFGDFPPAERETFRARMRAQGIICMCPTLYCTHHNHPLTFAPDPPSFVTRLPSHP